MQIKLIMWYYCEHNRMATIKATNNFKSGDYAKQQFSYTAGDYVN